jgi:predicted DNA-binding transcriptional regulator YafY
VAGRLRPTVGALKDDGRHTMAEVGADDFEWLAGYLINAGWDFEVLEPSEWRGRMADPGRRSTERHG